ncbi:PAQR family membrane homeostasis protein TrhA [Mariniblastus fucicola]|uniref:Hemolysin-III related n=1 Tax=Mariniblastus fucicola TaxID=980251 RepID=A0A5B9P7P9_9BACT|nr:hemolysin III family protein [Mariniblastus fucicola]QEG21225.1 hemolysin-III related [Mariniblastus fucicola]
MDEWYSISGFNDPMSSLSHLVGLVLFAAFSIFLVISAWHSRSKLLFSLQFIAATLFMLSMSFVYHMMAIGSTAREVMLRLDVASIFILIASTFTVIHGMLFVGRKRWMIPTALWSIVIVGVTLRTIFFHSIPSVVGDGIFLLMGWLGAASSWLLWKEFGFEGIKLVVIGGLFYTVGALINATGQPVFIQKVWGPHETFHLLVLAGLGTHWAFVWSIADGSFQRNVVKASRRNRLNG